MRQSERQVSHKAFSEYSDASLRAPQRVMRTGVAIFSVLSLITLAACGGDKQSDVALGSDSALGRDLALAASDTNASIVRAALEKRRPLVSTFSARSTPSR